MTNELILIAIVIAMLTLVMTWIGTVLSKLLDAVTENCAVLVKCLNANLEDIDISLSNIDERLIGLEDAATYWVKENKKMEDESNGEHH